METKKIKVLVCRPNEAPQVEEHADTLETWQELVGGYIEEIYPHDDDTCIILNEEGKIIGLPLNRPLKAETGRTYDVMCGTIVIARAPQDSDTFASLTDEQVAKYSKMYAEPIREEDAGRFEPLAEPRWGFIPLEW